MKTVRSRFEYFLAKIAGREVDITDLTPPMASDTTEELMLEIADRLGGDTLLGTLEWGKETHGDIGFSVHLPDVENKNAINEITYIFAAQDGVYEFTAPDGYILEGEMGFVGQSDGNTISYSLRDGSIYEMKFKVIDDTYITADMNEYMTVLPNYLCFTAEEDGCTITMVAYADDPVDIPAVSLETSRDRIEWEPFIVGETEIILDSAGDKVYFRGDNDYFGVDNLYWHSFSISGRVGASGSIMSLIDKMGRNIPLNPFTFFRMFADCTSLTTAPELPATTLAERCYTEMFVNCASLTTAPELPATTLAEGCYAYMFAGTSLITAPELPATTLVQACYASMFENCPSLITAPELPVTTLAERCYVGMFYGCASLTAAPELPATTLADRCYEMMFSGCVSLTTAPELPATTLTEGCYVDMFVDCTSLTTAPELPATTLAMECYAGMFVGTSLITAPELPATTLAVGCYANMFRICSSLTTAPELPATTLAEGCYNDMFIECVSLTTAPELPATTLAEHCYAGMFADCTSLTTAPELPATTLAEHCYEGMFSGCVSLYVSDTIDDEYNIAWKIPANMAADGDYEMDDMFYGCSGLRDSDNPNFDGIQKIYYTQNTPV